MSVFMLQGVIDSDAEQVFELAAHVVQATIGDYTEYVLHYFTSLNDA